MITGLCLFRRLRAMPDPKSLLNTTETPSWPGPALSLPTLSSKASPGVSKEEAEAPGVPWEERH